MREMDVELELIADKLRPIFKTHGVLKAIVFGSMARGECAKHSDLDLIVVMNTHKRFLDRYDDLLAPIVTAVDRPVDLLIYTPEEIDAISHRPFIARALHEGITIYESVKECA